MNTAFTALELSFPVVTWVENETPEICVNDAPMPKPTNQQIPALVGDQWLAGTVLSFSFTTLAPQDTSWLASLNGQLATVTVFVPEAGWRRVQGQCSWANLTLTVTLQTAVTISPWVTPI